MAQPTRPPTWSELPTPARWFRLAHIAWGVASLGALGWIWRCALAGRRDRGLTASVAWLGLEGVALLVGHGDCPMGDYQRSLGDPVPMFELVLPPRAAKAAIPVLAVVTAIGIAGAVARGRTTSSGR